MDPIQASAPHMKKPEPKPHAQKSQPDHRSERDSVRAKERDDNKKADKTDKNENVRENTEETSTEVSIDGFDALMDTLLNTPAPTAIDPSAVDNLPLVDAPTLQPQLIAQDIDPTLFENLGSAEVVEIEAPEIIAPELESGLVGTETGPTIAAPTDVASVVQATQNADETVAQVIKPTQNGAQKADPFALDMADPEIDGDLTFNDRSGLAKQGEGRAGNLPSAAPTPETAQVGVKATANPNSMEALVQAMSSASGDEAAEIANSTPTNSSSGGATSANLATQTAAKDPILAQRAINLTGVEIARSAMAGRTRFEIKLDPPELGRIEVRMIMDKEKAQAKLVIEKPETLDLMLRDKSQLEKLIAATGLELAEDGIDMQLKDDGQADQNGFADMLGDSDGKSNFFSPENDDAHQSNPTQADAEALIAMSQMQIARNINNPNYLNRMA